jgi:hypothetical protein
VPSRSERKRTYLTVLVTSVTVFAFVVVAPTAEMQDLRRLVGLGGERLDAAPVVPDGPGSYQFLQSQPQSDEPVGYDPCRAIEVEVNPERAPEGYDELVETAIAHTSGATGLRFERVGLTDRRPPKLATPRRQPVLVAWATADEVPELAGDVAGIGGSTAVERGFRDRSYVTGQVVLDAAVFDDIADGAAQAIIDHEFGHLVGLDHVDDPRELMYSDNVGLTTYGPGDLKGLARIGNIPC